MYNKSFVITFYAETPVHMGTGQGVSYVDNPLQRERHTSFPVLCSSGIKGVFRNIALRVWNDKDKIETIFGPEDSSSNFSSCISITDAKILLYPVRSVKGVFAWITCPFVLKRFKQDLKIVAIEFKDKNNQEIQIPNVTDNKIIVASNNSALKIDNNQVALEEFVFDIENNQNSDNIAEKLFDIIPKTEFDKNFFKNHFAIVSDDVFKDLVNYAVEIRTRIKIDQTMGTVKEGALFTQELIPSETVFYSLVFINDPYFGIDRELYKMFFNNKNNDNNWQKTITDIENEINNLKNSQNNDQKNKYDKLKKDFQKIKNDITIKKRMQKAYNDNYFSAEKILEELLFINHSTIQLGSDETLGKGFVKIKFWNFNTNQEDQKHDSQNL